ncbi:MAG: hypothetical protein ABH885_02575 [Candidatus Omnitrophota bacterium]
MAKKELQKEMAGLIEQLKVNLQRISKDAGILAKKGEKELVKASKIGKLQLDITGLNLQKEKLYYELGKKMAASLSKCDKADPELKPFLEKLRGIETDARKKKREMAQVRKEKNQKSD